MSVQIVLQSSGLCTKRHVNECHNILASERHVMFLSVLVSLCTCWSQWPGSVRHELSSPAEALGYWVRIPLEAVGEWNIRRYTSWAFTAVFITD
jgi:hypothetical protein